VHESLHGPTRATSNGLLSRTVRAIAGIKRALIRFPDLCVTRLVFPLRPLTRFARLQAAGLFTWEFYREAKDCRDSQEIVFDRSRIPRPSEHTSRGLAQEHRLRIPVS
jgi:hypothetical protein